MTTVGFIGSGAIDSTARGGRPLVPADLLWLVSAARR
jgi:hypothetical protein